MSWTPWTGAHVPSLMSVVHSDCSSTTTPKAPHCPCLENRDRRVETSTFLLLSRTYAFGLVDNMGFEPSCDDATDEGDVERDPERVEWELDEEEEDGEDIWQWHWNTKCRIRGYPRGLRNERGREGIFIEVAVYTDTYKTATIHPYLSSLKGGPRTTLGPKRLMRWGAEVVSDNTRSSVGPGIKVETQGANGAHKRWGRKIKPSAGPRNRGPR